MLEPDTATYVCVLAAYAQRGHLEDAQSIFDRMPEKNLLAWTAMLVAHAQRGRLEDARRIFHGMVERDLVAWTALVGALAQQGHVEEAKEVFDKMPHLDLVSWNAMIAGYAQNGRVAAARSLFAKTPHLGLPVWNGIISACAQNGDGRAALGLFRAMAWEGFEPNTVTFVSVLLACGRIGSVENTVGYFVSLVGDFGVAAMLDHYMCVVDQLARTGQLDHAQDLIESMPFEPDSVAWTILLGACNVQADVEQGSLAARLASSLDPENSVPYLLLSNAWISGSPI
ncbi:pentatricopeptide repeat-containing protein At2g13600-like [Selaginella moellendorffii]|uniref:pentatricopeptide repeat-containing protein At2g13600-like n=1 Tax=Selaginella moellendorffii TaxID=88036 RepID=UPI000D1CD928|nr:pentatricopeptide repeat-containing protein At2g13600-like [Selaginella moellendorffii]|eukprot:XP_024527904.1 pentatricopeptide repeat-containing protein At2g13600-like [Selaginella moellendorffii]